MRFITFVLLTFMFAFQAMVQADELRGRLEFQPPAGNGKLIVLLAGDEEYRSEESLPMLAKILSQKHGFRCIVLFSMGADDATYIDPNQQAGVCGLEALEYADLAIIAARFRRPDANQAAYLADFLNAGKPLIGIRTATHAFAGTGLFGGTLPYEKFGLKILGEEWVSHHGRHKVQGTRAVVEQAQADHPILQGVGDITCPSDVYGVIHLTDADQILLRGAVTESLANNAKIVAGEKNDPLQPLAWLHTYQSPNGLKTGQSFCTTAGASVDFTNAGLRRLVVNAAYYLCGLDVPAQADVDFVDPFHPSFYGFINDASYWPNANLSPADFGLGKSPKMPDPPGSPQWP